MRLQQEASHISGFVEAQGRTQVLTYIVEDPSNHHASGAANALHFPCRGHVEEFKDAVPRLSRNTWHDQLRSMHVGSRLLEVLVRFLQLLSHVCSWLPALTLALGIP